MARITISDLNVAEQELVDLTEETLSMTKGGLLGPVLHLVNGLLGGLLGGLL